MARYEYIRPGNEDEFEDFCVRFYRQSLKRSGLVRYGKRGERQDGIDIIDQLCLKPLIAIQCKRHEPTKTIPPQEIKDEVSKVESSSQSVDHYIIATTARKSTNAQNTVQQLNQRSDESRQFKVEIHFWEDIYTRLNEFGRTIADFIFDGKRSDEEFLKPVQCDAGSYATADSANEAGELYSEIDTLFKDRRLEAAEHDISKLADPEQDSTLSTRRRYAILRLRAKLALEQLQFDEAARLFTLAYETCPELQQARQNRVLALSLSGEQKQAFVEAERFIRDGIETAFLISLLINNSSVSTDLSPHQDAINKYISSAEDVNVAIAHRYLAWDQPKPAIDAAQRAIDVAPKSAHALFARGMVAHHSALQGDWQHRNENLTDAIRYYSEAITAAERDKYSGLLPEIYFNRGRVNAVVGDLNQAVQDYRSAVRVSERPSLYAEAAVSFFLHILDYNSAREMLPILDATSDEAAFFTAVTEYYHAPYEKKKDYIIALASLAGREFNRATEARIFCVQWAIDLKDFPLARQCVPESFFKRQPFQGNTLLGWIELEDGNKERARENAALALDSSSRAAHQQEIAFLARLLVRLEEDDKALPLLERVATPGVLDDDCKQLIECAQRLNRHDTLLRICAELRQTNRQDNLIRKLEVQLLSNYAPDRAFDLVKQFVQYDEPYFSVVSNYLAVRLGKIDEVNFDNKILPSPNDFEPDEAYLVVTPYIEVGRYRDALEYLYQQLRMHFTEAHAHGQYIWYWLTYGKKANIPIHLEFVDEQSAVRLNSLTTGESRWVIAEDRQPDLARNEYSCSTSVVQTLVGKQIGDIVDLCGPSVQPQEERVVEVQTKYVCLFQDVLSNFQRRFPDVGAIQSMHLGSKENFDPSPLIENLGMRRQHVEEVTAFYHTNLCSLHFLSSQLGINERQLIIGLTDHDERFVRCVECSPQQYSEAAEAGFDTNKVVLDLSAIVTVSRLNAWSQLDKEREYLVSRATSDRIAEWLHLTETGSQPTAYSYLSDNGKIIIQEVTQEQLQNDRNEIQTIVTEVGALSAVKSSFALAKLDPIRREQYIRVCGLHTIESVILARDENALLWTDDLFVGVLAEADFGVKRIWTQLAFKVLENAGRIGGDIYSEITAKLAAWNYVATIWNPLDVISAGNLCDWDVSRWPLKQCIRLIGTCPLPPLSKARIALEVFRLLRRSACSELRQSPIVQAVLDALGNTNTVVWMRQNLDQYFRIDVSSAEFMKLELAYWLRLR